MWGSIFVTNHALAFLKGMLVQFLVATDDVGNNDNRLTVHLQHSKFVADVDDIVACFDKTTKLRFRNSSEPAFIKFGSRGDKDCAVGITAGQLKLKG
ncbi:hypothetical protein H0H81_006725 [Sphagnurus paluster]|uniref:Uncharacterized protein n=1 Tax=Sphagnurus paluster TaxID=117069 RepID=A0A9P7GKY5_9AGAR|nr:hypothetical protein H0H81_006725 [Sphagnurus paluster]